MLELIGKKIGMSHIFSDDGVMTAVSFIKLHENTILDIKASKDIDFDKVTIAFDKVSNPKKINKSQIGLFNKKSVALFKNIKESKVKKGFNFKICDSLPIDAVIKEGDVISVSGITIGKGFAGVMKRHNFRGLEASHGVSISHRSHGSTGQRQDPGKVFKGKKMAGHMGVDKVTVKNLKVLMVDVENSVFGIKGAIPGNSGNDVIIKIAKI